MIYALFATTYCKVYQYLLTLRAHIAVVTDIAEHHSIHLLKYDTEYGKILC